MILIKAEYVGYDAIAEDEHVALMMPFEIGPQLEEIVGNSPYISQQLARNQALIMYPNQGMELTALFKEELDAWLLECQDTNGHPLRVGDGALEFFRKPNGQLFLGIPVNSGERELGTMTYRVYETLNSYHVNDIAIAMQQEIARRERGIRILVKSMLKNHRQDRPEFAEACSAASATVKQALLDNEAICRAAYVDVDIQAGKIARNTMPPMSVYHVTITAGGRTASEHCIQTVITIEY